MAQIPAQQATPQKPVMQPAVSSVPQPATTQPIAEQAQPVEEKPSMFKKWWFWLIIALIIIGAGAGAYFLFFQVA